MVARIRLLQVAIAVVNLAIVALAFTSVWPFPSGQFKVDLPSASEITWTYDNGVVHVTAPYSIDNHGFYDVKNLVLDYNVTNDSLYPLAGEVIPIGDIPSGRVTSSAIDFRFDLLALFRSGAEWMVFNDDLLRFHVGVSCLYTAKLVEFAAEYQVQVPWDALIRDYGVSGYSWGTTATPLGAVPDSLNVTYWLDTSELLASIPTATVEIDLRGNSTLLGTGSGQVRLGGNYSGSFSFSINPSALTVADPPTLFYLDIHIAVADFSDTRTIEIPAPSIPAVTL